MSIGRLHISIAILVIFHAIGIGGVLLGEPSEFLKLTPLNLLITLGLILFNQGNWKKSQLLPVVYLLGHFIEVVGVNTGWPFGAYAYGEVFGPQLWNVPLVMGVNWLILIYASNAVAMLFTKTMWLRASVAALFMVLLDYVLEPVAMTYDFWQWEGGQPPWENYASWLSIGFLISLLWQRSGLATNKVFGIAIWLTQFAFFLTLAALS